MLINCKACSKPIGEENLLSSATTKQNCYWPTFRIAICCGITHTRKGGEEGTTLYNSIRFSWFWVTFSNARYFWWITCGTQIITQVCYCLVMSSHALMKPTFLIGYCYYLRSFKKPTTIFQNNNGMMTQSNSVKLNQTKPIQTKLN